MTISPRKTSKSPLVMVGIAVGSVTMIASCTASPAPKADDVTTPVTSSSQAGSNQPTTPPPTQAPANSPREAVRASLEKFYLPISGAEGAAAVATCVTEEIFDLTTPSDHESLKAGTPDKGGVRLSTYFSMFDYDCGARLRYKTVEFDPNNPKGRTVLELNVNSEKWTVR